MRRVSLFVAVVVLLSTFVAPVDGLGKTKRNGRCGLFQRRAVCAPCCPAPTVSYCCPAPCSGCSMPPCHCVQELIIELAPAEYPPNTLPDVYPDIYIVDTYDVECGVDARPQLWIGNLCHTYPQLCDSRECEVAIQKRSRLPGHGWALGKEQAKNIMQKQLENTQAVNPNLSWDMDDARFHKFEFTNSGTRESVSVLAIPINMRSGTFKGKFYFCVETDPLDRDDLDVTLPVNLNVTPGDEKQFSVMYRLPDEDGFRIGVVWRK